MDLWPLVLSPGCLTEATGRVIAIAGRVWFEPVLPVRLIRYAPGREPAPRPSGLGVPVLGVDLQLLDRFRSMGGASEGVAHLRGHWAEDALVVDSQESPRAGRALLPRWDRPPCPAPVGGWGHSPEGVNLEPPADLEADPSVTNVMMVRPSPTQVVLIVVCTEPERVRAQLAADLADRVCVIASRWTPTQLRRIRSHLDARMQQWQLYSTGQSADADCQPILTAKAVRIVPDLAEWAREIPDGLLTLQAWLTPVPQAQLPRPINRTTRGMVAR